MDDYIRILCGLNNICMLVLCSMPGDIMVINTRRTNIYLSEESEAILNRFIPQFGDKSKTIRKMIDFYNTEHLPPVQYKLFKQDLPLKKNLASKVHEANLSLQAQVAEHIKLTGHVRYEWQDPKFSTNGLFISLSTKCLECVTE